MSQTLPRRNVSVSAAAAAQPAPRPPLKTIQMFIESLKVRNRMVYVWASQALIEVGEPAVPHLIAALDDPDDQVWRLALVILIKIGQPAAPYLVAALDHPSEHIRLMAAAALQKMGRRAPIDTATWQRVETQVAHLFAQQTRSQ
jgi:HEAT repeat protein